MDAGREEMQMIASALRRLPARVLWKLSKREVAAAGGLEALNLAENVKVGAPATPQQVENMLCSSMCARALR